MPRHQRISQFSYFPAEQQTLEGRTETGNELERSVQGSSRQGSSLLPGTMPPSCPANLPDSSCVSAPGQHPLPLQETPGLLVSFSPSPPHPVLISVTVVRASSTALIQTCEWICGPQSLWPPEGRHCVFLTLVPCLASTHWFAVGGKKEKKDKQNHQTTVNGPSSLSLCSFSFSTVALISPRCDYLLQFFVANKKG